MYTNVSNDFIAALSGDSRTFRARITAGNETVTNIISYTLVAGSCGREAFCPGAVFSSYVDLVLPASEISLSGREFLLETGILLDDDTVEYVPMGYYAASPSDIAASRDQVTVKAYDRIKNKCGGVYEPSVTFPTTIWNVLNDLSYQAGIVILTSCATTGIVDTAMNGLTVAETLGYIAGLLGGFCWADRTGNIRIDPFPQTSVLQVEKSRIMSLSTSGDEYELTGITVMVPPVRTESEEDPEEIAYTTGSGTKLVLSNPYMTETLFSSMAASLIGYSFYPGSIRFLGDPRLDPVDAITAVNYADDTFLIPCMEINQGFDGGLVTTVSAPGLNVSDEGARGPLTQTLTRLEPDINQAKIAAKRAVHIAGNTAQHFWHTEEGTDTGAHITEIPKEEFLEDPANGGGNLLARSNGVAVRDGLTELATFGADGVQIGQDADAAMKMTSGAINIIIGGTVIGKIYYDDETGELVIHEETTKNNLRLGTYGASIQNEDWLGFHAEGYHSAVDGGLYVKFVDSYYTPNAIEAKLDANTDVFTVDWDGNVTCKDIATTSGSDQVKIVENISLGSISVNANGAADATVNIASSIPSGYKLAAAIPRGTGSYAFYFYLCVRASDTSVRVTLFRSTGSATSVSPSIAAICVKA